jgi:1-acyl-sn-glycerol-3-phosphate acyltransferase
MSPADPGTRAGPPEGLDWLGRAPTAHPGWIVRGLLRAFRWASSTIAAIHVTVEGAEQLPAGPCIIACASHRSWFDGPLLMSEFVAPRIWYIASAGAIFRFPGLEWAMRRFGGMVPVVRGGMDVDVHVHAAQTILDAGARFVIYPEGTRAGDGEHIAPIRRGVGLIGLRTGAVIVPVALGGTKALYRGRRIGLRILPPTTAVQLAGLAIPPAQGSQDELGAARAATDALAALLAPHVTELATRAQDPPDHPRQWSWMSNLFA